MKINSLKNINDWEDFKKKASAGYELIIFKFSPVCGISFYAESIFQDWADELQELRRIKLSKVNVISARKLSQQIAGELNVSHESPQVIWLNKDFSIKWNASHYEINKAEMDKNLTDSNKKII
ncbi:MAG: bacillithiol system redox-active protein YtxJ [Ignavibacteria bacterium]|nr:bacillithiol system redox-active protein YtxJ [Ignavibacteria bacterium]